MGLEKCGGCGYWLTGKLMCKNICAEFEISFRGVAI